MSDILSRISDDIDEYLYLCKRFNEPAEYSKTYSQPASSVPDCYGEHARKLKARLLQESSNA